VVTKTLSFAEETEVISSLYTAVAYLKRMRDDSISNRDYWSQRVGDHKMLLINFTQNLKHLFDYYGFTDSNGNYSET
jgi:hypothetical protein